MTTFERISTRDALRRSRLPEQAQVAINQLLAVANRRTDQGRKVASFLLSWWSADDWGGFDPRILWSVDDEIEQSMLAVLLVISRFRAYPDSLGYGVEFRLLCDQWKDLMRSE
ncbi:hypothetical protein [Paraburkholderia sp. J12]|uniref:DUF7673 family protein n=1 Tax=Paraburkholderia sp. J12 TaxID=2805432 RepID=UPI002ABE5C75|nr:hypothetical protein [Paraburkholderia sp. J12]